jgi:hypothetical protein
MPTLMLTIMQMQMLMLMITMTKMVSNYTSYKISALDKKGSR